MCVIELDGSLLRQLFPIRVVAKEAAHQVSQRTRNQEILLDKSQFLSGHGGVVGIQHASQRFRFESPTQCTDEISGAEFLKVEIIRSSRSPEAESIDGFSSVAYHRTIVRYAKQAGWPIRSDLNASVPNPEGAVQLDFHFFVRALNLPRIAIAQPVIGILSLPAIHKRLAKHAVLVAEAITGGRKLHGGHGVEEARREATQTSVSQTGIRF